MAIGEGVLPRRQAEHIELTLGNFLMVGLMAVLFETTVRWTSSWAARQEIPVVSQLAVGTQFLLKAS